MRWIPGLATVMLAGAVGCTDAETTSPTPPWYPVAGISSIQLDGDPMPYAEILGRPRAQIEEALPTGRPGRDAGWIRYGENLLVEYDEQNVAVRLRARTPQAFGCYEAARWMGFPYPRQTVLEGSRCVWPGARVSRRLEKGYGGEYDVDTRWFRVWLVDGQSALG